MQGVLLQRVWSTIPCHSVCPSLAPTYAAPVFGSVCRVQWLAVLHCSSAWS